MGERDDGYDDELLGLSLGLGSGHPGKNRRRSSASAPRSPSFELNLSLAGGHARGNPPENSQAYRRHPISCNPQLRHPEVSFDTSPPLHSGGVGFDVNGGAPLPYLPFPEDENAALSPNSTLSSISAGKRVEREVAVDNENEGERTSCSRGSDEDDGGAGGVGGGDGEGRKKLRLSREQSMVLEETFKAHSTLNPKQKLALAEQLNLRPRQVEVWFQNRRARTKLKQTEVDCEYLKRCCENLTQENRRLQREVQELRALKLSPHLYMHLNPPTTLTMCPSCERVAALSTSSSSYAPAAANLPPGS